MRDRDICECCGQSTTYELDIDKGTVDMLKTIALFIRNKEINAVHPRKEMEPAGLLTSNQINNLSRPRFHGLIAKVKGNAGNYLLTPKGAKFLKGEPVMRTVLVSKGKADQSPHNAGYIEKNGEVDIYEFLGNDWKDYWESNGYEIKEGRVVTRETLKKAQTLFN